MQLSRLKFIQTKETEMLKKLCLIIPLLFAFPVQAAVTPNSIITAQTPNEGKLQFTSSSTPGTFVTAYTAGSNGTKVSGIFVNNTDSTATHVVQCAIFNATVEYSGWSVTTTSPAAGAQINLAFFTTWLGLPVDSDQNPFLYLVNGDTIQCTYATAVTAGKAVNIEIIASDF